MAERPHLRLVPTSRRREIKPLRARISVREFGVYGRSREFALSERDLRELIDTAVRLEAKS